MSYQTMDDTLPFPIQAEQHNQKASSIPWWLAEIAYKQYSKLFSNKQSLERLAQRGGFGRKELITLLRKKNPVDAS